MPAKINRHGDCRLKPLADALQGNLSASLQRIRTAVRTAVSANDEERADRLRADQLAVGELMAQVQGIMDRHLRDGLSEQRGELELAGVRRSLQAIDDRA